jgi:hypothetical protein
MNSQDINKEYISPYDIFLRKFDLSHELSASQLREIKKHARIAHLRDNVELNPIPPKEEVI